MLRISWLVKSRLLKPCSDTQNESWTIHADKYYVWKYTCDVCFVFLNRGLHLLQMPLLSLKLSYMPQKYFFLTLYNTPWLSVKTNACLHVWLMDHQACLAQSSILAICYGCAAFWNYIWMLWQYSLETVKQGKQTVCLHILAPGRGICRVQGSQSLPKNR